MTPILRLIFQTSYLALIVFSQSIYAGPERFSAPPTDWTLESPNVEPTVGHRPFREGGIRLEKEDKNGVTFVHNYGHGGAGLTLSWGTAHAAIDLVSSQIKRSKEIVVIGGGVIGLTTSYILLKQGYSVSLYSDQFFPNNVSNIAGGLWSPVSVDLSSQDSAAKAKLHSIQVQSYQIYEKLMNEGWPVRRIPMFVTEEAQEKSGLDLFHRMPELFNIVPHKKIPIEGVEQSGYEVITLLIDTPRYMAQLSEEAKRLGLKFLQRKFSTMDEIANEVGTGAIVFNSTGLGARELAKDSKVVPVRGDLIYIRKTDTFDPWDYAYMAFYGPQGTDYAFFRKGEVVVGGTFRMGDSSTAIEHKTCVEKLRSFRAFFNP